jgi:hypothetical protein
MEQDCDTGCRRWSRNRSFTSRDCRFPAPLGARLTLQRASANPQSSHPERYDQGVELPHSEPAHDDHQPSKLMNNSSQENAEALIPIDAGQNSDYSAGYSTGSLQGRRQINYPKTQREL